MLYYIPSLVDKTTCIGNSLSTFNLSFSSLDTNLYNLSVYTVNSVNFLSSTMIAVSSTLNNRVNFLSSSIISVSSTLANRIDSLSSYVYSTLTPNLSSLSADVGQIEYTLTNSVFSAFNAPIKYSSTSNGQSLAINFNPSSNLIEKHNAQIRLNHDISLSDFVYSPEGLHGNISVFIDTVGKSVTGYGPMWQFSGSSAMNTTVSARNVIRYYVDEINNSKKILAELLTYSF